jgi:ssDNA-binding Zn-finger/Zn-ribbon topoisomerase 1
MQTCGECGSNLQIIRGEPYHYVGCGLNNVYLHGINQYKCPRCGESGPEIPKVEALVCFECRGLSKKGVAQRHPFRT